MFRSKVQLDNVYFTPLIISWLPIIIHVKVEIKEALRMIGALVDTSRRWGKGGQDQELQDNGRL